MVEIAREAAVCSRSKKHLKWRGKVALSLIKLLTTRSPANTL